MVSFYKIKDFQWTNQTLEDLEEHDGLAMFKITIKSESSYEFFDEDGGYDNGWPLMFSSTDEWGFRSFEMANNFFNEVDDPTARNVITRDLYVYLPPDVNVKIGDWTVFANQYQFRIGNEELRQVLDTLPGEEADFVQYSINKQNILTRIND